MKISRVNIHRRKKINYVIISASRECMTRVYEYDNLSNFMKIKTPT